MNPSPEPKPGILDIAPYTPGRAAAPGRSQAIKLSANENPGGCSAAAREAYLAEINCLHRYPDPRAGPLRDALCVRHGLSSDRLIFGCGSDELFTLVCQAWIRPGETVVQPQHGFAAWAIAARAAGGGVIAAPERDQQVDVDSLLGCVDHRTRIVFVANPANPTGTWLPAPEIERLHDHLPPGVILVLDEAYAEYAGGSSGDLSNLSRRSRRTLTTRTFSKAFGLAGLRVGWGVAAPTMIEAMERIRPPFNVSRPAIAAAVAALADTRFLDESIRHVDRWRSLLRDGLQALGLVSTLSATNFITFAVPPSSGWTAVRLEQALAVQGVLVRGLAGYDLAEWLRVTIGTDAENERFLTVLSELMGNPAPGSPDQTGL